jgi:uncharacterized alpha-E superfamily protein
MVAIMTTRTLKRLERAELLDAAIQARNATSVRYEDRQWNALLRCMAAITEYLAHAQRKGAKRKGRK